jgi:hypothetical protein
VTVGENSQSEDAGLGTIQSKSARASSRSGTVPT